MIRVFTVKHSSTADCIHGSMSEDVIVSAPRTVGFMGWMNEDTCFYCYECNELLTMEPITEPRQKTPTPKPLIEVLKGDPEDWD